LMGLPQHWLSDDIRAGVERVCRTARERGVMVAIHTHVNAAQSVTPLVAKATKTMFDASIHNIHNQNVLIHNINNSIPQLLNLYFTLLNNTTITPYYFYMYDMIPFSKH